MEIKEIMKNFEKNNMQPYYADTKQEVLSLVESFINKGDTVAVGGSVSLDECGVLKLLRSGNYNFLDRYNPDLTPEQRKEVLKSGLTADTFLCSSNAITEQGELINVDGIGNRVAPLIYGPESVIVVVGENKIVKNAEDGLKRVKQIAAPKNTVRLNRDTYCKEKGICMGLSSGENCITSGCNSPQRICCSYVVSAYQLTKNRIKVIICKENLGY